MSLTGKTREEQIWNFLYDEIGNPYGVAGLMGNLQCESGLNPCNLEDTYNAKLGFTDEEYCEAVDNGTYKSFITDSAGWGLAQWTWHTRKKALQEYAKSKSKSIGDLETQLGFLVSELSTSYTSVYSTLQNATSVKEASNAVLLKFECPLNSGSAVQQTRASYGTTYYNRYGLIKQASAKIVTVTTNTQATPVSTETESKEGSKMTNKQIQCLLAYLGYYTGTIDGVLGSGSKAAIRSFQTASKLTVDGIAGTKTQAALIEAVANGNFKSAVATTTASTTAQATTTNTSSSSTASAPSTGDSFWDETPHFKRSEFACQCGGKYCNGYPAEPQEKLVRIAERMREHFGVPVTISSGLRCTKHNAEVGGVSNSRHLSGKAMDFSVQGKTATQILAWTQAQSDLRYSYAINSSYVHMDIL